MVSRTPRSLSLKTHLEELGGGVKASLSSSDSVDCDELRDSVGITLEFVLRDSGRNSQRDEIVDGDLSYASSSSPSPRELSVATISTLSHLRCSEGDGERLLESMVESRRAG